MTHICEGIPPVCTQVSSILVAATGTEWPPAWLRIWYAGQNHQTGQGWRHQSGEPGERVTQVELF